VLRERLMLGAASGAVKEKRSRAVVFLLLACITAATGCFWRSYPQRLSTHAELLVSIARKARDLVATGRFTAENLPELTYPLERAAAYAADAHRRAPKPPSSLVAFDRLIERYRAYVELVDSQRRERDGAAAVRAVESSLADVEAAARDVAAALAQELNSAAGG
jgi:maltooligosyltrehalose synthase